MVEFFRAIEGITAYLSESSLVFLIGLGMVVWAAVRLGPDIIRAIVDVHKINKEHDARMTRLNSAARRNFGRKRREADERDKARGDERHD